MLTERKAKKKNVCEWDRCAVTIRRFCAFRGYRLWSIDGAIATIRPMSIDAFNSEKKRIHYAHTNEEHNRAIQSTQKH